MPARDDAHGDALGKAPGFLLSFKYILGTSLPGSVLLAVFAGLLYAVMAYFIGGSFSWGGGSNGIIV